jgi:hypothetical protein
LAADEALHGKQGDESKIVQPDAAQNKSKRNAAYPGKLYTASLNNEYTITLISNTQPNSGHVASFSEWPTSVLASFRCKICVQPNLPGIKEGRRFLLSYFSFILLILATFFSP